MAVFFNKNTAIFLFLMSYYFSVITKSSKTKSESFPLSFSIPNQELPFSEPKKLKVAIVGVFASFKAIAIL